MNSRGFNGDFRKKPVQDIRGASRHETKDELVARAKRERLEREVTAP
jgi:hypothetical protein